MGRKKASEYTLIAYCGWNLFWMWLGMRLYVEHLMTRVKIGPLDLNIDQSNLLFFVLMGLCELTGMFSAWYNRTGCQIAANILFPPGNLYGACVFRTLASGCPGAFCRSLRSGHLVFHCLFPGKEKGNCQKEAPHGLALRKSGVFHALFRVSAAVHAGTSSWRKRRRSGLPGASVGKPKRFGLPGASG